MRVAKEFEYEDDPIVGTNTLSKLTGISRSTIIYWTDLGLIPCFRPRKKRYYRLRTVLGLLDKLSKNNE
jgi:DNA-binding transcriptional MerR regulator